VKNKKSLGFLNTPLGLFTVLCALVTGVELLIMLVLEDIIVPAVVSEFAWSFVDATLLAFVVAPALYFLVFRKMQQDIAERSRSQQALMESVAHTQAILDNTVDGMISINAQGIIESFNHAAERTFGYAQSEVIGQNVKMLMPEPYHSEHDGYLHNYRSSGVPRIIGMGREVRGRRKDGSTFPLDLAVSQVTHEGRPLYIGLARDITVRKQAEEELLRQHQLREVIARAQSHFIAELDRHAAFDKLLTDVQALTCSEYGFLADVLRTGDARPYLKMQAITNLAWDEATRRLYAENVLSGIEFTNLNTLFGAAIISGAPVIANDAAHDPRRGGVPEGHPALNTYLGIPIYYADGMVAMLGLANRPGGYDAALIEFLQPLLATIGQLLVARRNQARQREDQASIARLSRVASQTTNGVIITDAQGKTEWINEGFTRLTGFTLDEMKGRRPGELLQGPDTNSEAVNDMREALRRREPFHAELINYTKAGTPCWMHISCNPLFNSAGELQGFIAIESDVTERHQAEAALIAAKEKAERAYRAKSQFLSSMSHELRTPMNAVLGFAELLQLDPTLSVEQKEYIDGIFQGGLHLLELVDKVLNLAKIESGTLKLDMGPVSVAAIVHDCLTLIRPLADARGIELESADCPNLVVIADSLRLKQVLLNLLSNSIKYNRPNGHIRLHYFSTRGGQLARINVCDTGHGIPTERMNELFEPFNRLGLEGGTIQGTGVGLTISRQLMALMGGSINAESTFGVGSTFWVELPRATAATHD